MMASLYEDLLDYRQQVAKIYRRVRSSDHSLEKRWQAFREERDALFATHPQSALSPEQKVSFRGLSYFEYQPAFRFVVPVDTAVEPTSYPIVLEQDGAIELVRFGRVRFPIASQEVALYLYWIKTYGGGLFLPFRDTTNGSETYGGGRYLLDTIKHVDLGRVGSDLVLDFNFAYNPSCAYNLRWHCPLAPKENWLSVSIPAGEKDFRP